ncbi:MAG: hypothetical protein IKT40_03405 [Bacilli bacterium]|nr:hypothetical protein [Bacilli bacterium]
MNKYHKIETLYVRDEKTKKLIVGSFRNKTVEFLKDNTWQFTEKVDGTNIRVYWDGHNVTFGGRTDNAQIPSHLINRLNVLFGGETNAQLFEQKFGETPVTLFGEGYGPKIQSGGAYRNDVDFILFDVLIGDDLYLERENVEDIAKYFGIDVVPIVLEGTIQDGVDYVTKGDRKSIIAQNGALIEGLVGRPKMELRDRRGERMIVKIKYKDFE